MKKHFNSSGQTLLEAIIALGAILVVLAATSVAVITSLNNSSYIKQQNQANKLAQQGMEYVRDRISTDEFANYRGYSTSENSTQCLVDLSSVDPFSPGACDGTETIQNTFVREVRFTSNVSCGSGAPNSFTNGLEVVVDVKWTSGKCAETFCHKQQLKSCFLDPSKIVPTETQGI